MSIAHTVIAVGRVNAYNQPLGIVKAIGSMYNNHGDN